MGFDLKSAVANLANTLTGGLLEKVWGTIDKVIPDANQKVVIKAQLDTLAMTQDHETLIAQIQTIISQLAINQEEAKSSSIFVAGWRPFVGWVCGVGLGMQFVLAPVIFWTADVLGKHIDKPFVLDVGVLMTLVTGMLGLVASRSYEKKNGVERNSLNE